MAEMERKPDIAAFATPLAGPGILVRIRWIGGRVELRARLHGGQISRAARLPKDHQRTEKDRRACVTNTDLSGEGQAGA